ncbi:hypothetical protein TH64_20425, partial [Mycobacterium tuberculosis]
MGTNPAVVVSKTRVLSSLLDALDDRPDSAGPMELPGAKRLGDDRRPLGTLRCWRHSDIGPARGIVVTPALKEWSAAVHALLDGRQTVLLRKGGIGEK